MLIVILRENFKVVRCCFTFYLIWQWYWFDNQLPWAFLVVTQLGQTWCLCKFICYSWMYPHQNICSVIWIENDILIWFLCFYHITEVDGGSYLTYSFKLLCLLFWLWSSGTGASKWDKYKRDKYSISLYSKSFEKWILSLMRQELLQAGYFAYLRTPFG